MFNLSEITDSFGNPMKTMDLLPRTVKLRLLQNFTDHQARLPRDIQEVQVKNPLLDKHSIFVYREPEPCRHMLRNALA